MFPILRELVERIASFKGEIADVRRRSIRRATSPTTRALRLRASASGCAASARSCGRRSSRFCAASETSKYLQEQVVTDRNGRYVLVVRAEHRSAIPGIVHGASASGASLFLEPLTTVDINNDIVALEEQEAEEVRRILLALTDTFRAPTGRSAPHDRRRDRARRDPGAGAVLSDGRAASSRAISNDGTFELRGARHPLLIRPAESDLRRQAVVPVDIVLIPPTRVHGHHRAEHRRQDGRVEDGRTARARWRRRACMCRPNTGSRLPVFQSLFADIGDEQSISASLSTFSAHITNVVSMDRTLALPALVLLDEVGAGTDPVEGGALGIAVIDHFRRRGAHLIATTHYDALKSYASTTEGVDERGVRLRSGIVRADLSR